MTQILIVDDNEANRYLLETLLRTSGFSAVSTADGQEALSAAKRTLPDLIVSDVLMPVMDGFALCRACQLDDRLRSIPFVFYTATYTDHKDQEFGLNLGAVAYLIKPEEPEVLLRKIRDVLATRHAVPLVAKPPIIEEAVFLREYNYTLVHKLERKMLQLEESNRELELEVNERRLTEVRLRQQTRLLDMASDAIICLGLDGVIRHWNRGAERVFGWSEMEVRGQRWDVLFGPLPTPVQNAINLTAESDWFAELTLMTKGQQPVIVDSRWTLVKDEQNLPQSVLAVCTNITQKKMLEAQFLRSQRMEVIGTMASGIAHDLNNILTPIVVATPMLRRKLPPNVDQELFRVIESSAERATGVLKQLLSFGRGMKCERVVVQMELLITEVVSLVAQTFPKNIRIVSHIAPHSPPLLGDTTQLHQLLLNLCINARDAMPRGGVIEIRTDLAEFSVTPAGNLSELKPGQYLKLTVSDNGSGIPPENLPKIFDPFFTTKDIGVGTGLGLATVQTIAKSHGGTVVVSSQLNQGARFDVYLPAFVEEPTATQGSMKYDAVSSGFNVTGNRKNPTRVLVVDDDPAIREIVRALLEYRGYRVVLATNAPEALRMAKDHSEQIALILADITMPHIDGIALFRMLREASISVPIVAMSGLRDSEQDVTLANLGVRHFLPKPFTGEELIQAIEGAIHT